RQQRKAENPVPLQPQRERKLGSRGEVSSSATASTPVVGPSELADQDMFAAISASIPTITAAKTSATLARQINPNRTASLSTNTISTLLPGKANTLTLHVPVLANSLMPATANSNPPVASLIHPRFNSHAASVRYASSLLTFASKSNTTTATTITTTSPATRAYHSSRKIIGQTPFVIRATTIVAADRGAPVELYHELHGHGSHKVLFITGWAGSCDNWRFQTEFFGQHGAFEVCIYENRGSGFSSDPKTQYAMRDMAQDAVDLMDQLGWESAHVVGVSMGGMIAQELALLAPSRIQSLTLASTSASRSLPPLRHIPWIISTFTKILLGLEKVKNMMPFFLYSQRWLNAPAPPNTGFSSNLEYMLKFHGGRIDSRPPQSFLAAIRQLSGIISFHISKQRLIELRNYFLRSRIPALVIHGTEDALVHLRASWNLASSLGARLVVFEGRGHALNHEDIDLFNRLLLRHFYSAILGTANAVVGQPQQQLFSATSLEVEQRAKAMVENLKRQMVGFRAWIWSLFGRTWDASAIVPIVEWLPFVHMKSEQKPHQLQAKVDLTAAIAEKSFSKDVLAVSTVSTIAVSHTQDHTGVLTSAASRITAEISNSEK
ncbi:hypothetical protein HK100_006280, partial [Physocladia obscura]